MSKESKNFPVVSQVFRWILLVVMVFTVSSLTSSPVLAKEGQLTPSLFLASLSQYEAGLKSAPITLSLTGKAFNSGSIVLWGSTSLTPTEATSTVLKVTVPAGLLATPGKKAVKIQNPDGKLSNFKTFNVLSVYDTPVIEGLDPASVDTEADAAGQTFQVTISGSKFIPQAKIDWYDPISKMTTSLTRVGTCTATQCVATVDKALIAQENTPTITVTNGTVKSNEVELTVNAIITEPAPTPTPDPEPAPVPAPSYVFNSDFEAGDYSSFSNGAGDYFGKGVFYEHKIVSSPAKGNYAAALTIGSGSCTAAYLFAYRTPSTPLAIYSVDYYIPGNVVPDEWWNVWQWKSIDNYYNKPIIDLNIVKGTGGLNVVMNYVPNGINTNPTQTFYQTNPIPFPTDRWVNITGYYMSKYDNSGYVVIYQDGVKIFEKSNFLTKPGNKAVLWSVNSYASIINPDPATIYVDNIRISESQ